MSNIYLGALSGTSIDSIDVAAVEFNNDEITLLDFVSSPIQQDIAQRIRNLQNEKQLITEIGQLDNELGYIFASAVKQLLNRKISAEQVTALGLHGQTVIHQPNSPFPFTIQIGDPNIVAAETALVTVADFRRADMANNGQGAPIVPAFHQFAFGKNEKNTAVVNIGGIANVTFLGDDGEVLAGFDTGPGNCLMDYWIRKHKHLPFDTKGQWASSEQPDMNLLNAMLDDPFFKNYLPKSACTSMFNLAWLNKYGVSNYPAEVVQATLAELTATCIANSIQQTASHTQTVLVCGGGAYNDYVIQRLKDISHLSVETTAIKGINPMHVETMAFAWLAQCRINQIEASLPIVTGAKQPAILGAIYQPV